MKHLEGLNPFYLPKPKESENAQAQIDILIELFGSEIEHNQKLIDAVDQFTNLKTHEATQSQRILQLMSEKDPEVQYILNDFNELLTFIDELSQNDGFVDLEIIESIESNKIVRALCSNTLRNYKHAIVIGQGVRAKELATLCQSVTNIQSTVQYLISTLDISKHIKSNVDLIIGNLELQKNLTLIQTVIEDSHINPKDAKLLRAFILKDTSEELLSPEVLTTIIDGKYSVTDPLMSGSILDSFKTFEKELDESTPESKHLKIKLARIVLMGSMFLSLSTMVVSSSGERYVDDHTIEELVGDKNIKFDTKELSFDQVEQESEDNGAESSISDPEKIPNIELWHFQKPSRSSYYADSTYTHFDSIKNRWYEDGTKQEKFTRVNFEFEDFSRRKNVYEMRYLLNTGEDFVKVPLARDMKIVGVSPGTQLYVNGNNIDYYAGSEITNLEGINILSVYYTFENTIQDKPNLEDLAIDQLIGDHIAQSDMKKLVEELKKESLTKPEIVEKINNFMKSYFIYSNDMRKDSHFRQNEQFYKPGKYVKMYADLKYVDCDVANTVQIALLRYFDIPTRFVSGYYKNAQTDKLNTHQKHGWAEWYDEVKGTWHEVDGTPPNNDEYAGFSNQHPDSELTVYESEGNIKYHYNPDGKEGFELPNINWPALFIISQLMSLLVAIKKTNEQKDIEHNYLVTTRVILDDIAETHLDHASGRGEFESFFKHELFKKTNSNRNTFYRTTSDSKNIFKQIKSFMKDIFTYAISYGIGIHKENKRMRKFYYDRYENKDISIEHKTNIISALELMGFDSNDLMTWMKRKNELSMLYDIRNYIITTLTINDNVIDESAIKNTLYTLAIEEDRFDVFLDKVLSYLFQEINKKTKKEKMSISHTKPKVTHEEFVKLASKIVIPLQRLYTLKRSMQPSSKVNKES